MEYLFAKIVFAHLAGDYLLQSRNMALHKSVKNLNGFSICLLHVLIYTFCVCLFVGIYRLDIVCLVFLSHFPIDFWSLGGKWLEIIGGRNILTAYNSKEKYHEIDLIFSCIVYTVVDNAIHLYLLYLIFVYYL